MIKVDPRAKALIFDIDGTLVDTMAIHFQAWKSVGEMYGFDYTRELFRDHAGLPTRIIAADLNERLRLHLDPEKVYHQKNLFYKNWVRQIKPVRPVVKLVEDYYGKIPMALGTGEVREIACMNLNAAGLDRFFEILVTADDVKNSKPDPETFLKCANLMGVSPEFCQVFEDGRPGLEAGRRAGMIVTDIRPFFPEYDW